MITVIITAYGEPKATKQAVDAVLRQKVKDRVRVIVTDPFPEVEEFIMKEFKNNSNVSFVPDLGEGKSVALNNLLEEVYSEERGNFLVFTDGDVFMDEGALQAILNEFKDSRVGLVCGHPVSLNDRKDKFGFWSHVLFSEFNETRKQVSLKGGFFEASGYLFAIRNGILKSFPLSSSEDNVIPYLILQKGFMLRYAEGARVWVLNPRNKKDWLAQKKRNLKGHISLKETLKGMKGRRNTFVQEAFRGLKTFAYPKSLREWVWLLELFVMRVQAWMLAYYEMYAKRKKYADGWREESIESTKPLD